MVFAFLFLVGAFRNAAAAVQPVAELNNVLLPLWLLILGASLMWWSKQASPAAGSDASPFRTV